MLDLDARPLVGSSSKHVNPDTGSEAWPQTGAQAIVRVEGGARILAEVTSATAHWLRLKPSDRDGAPDRVAHAALEYLAGERVYRLVGDLDTRQPDGQWR